MKFTIEIEEGLTLLEGMSMKERFEWARHYLSNERYDLIDNNILEFRDFQDKKNIFRNLSL